MATRRERVVIELEDGLTAGVLREAAAVAVLNREIDKLGRQSVGAKRSMDPLGQQTIPQTARNADSASRSIDKLSGRIELFAHGLAAIGPATVPIGAIAIPAVSTLASGLGFLTIGAGTTVLAFHNLGDALTKFNKAAAEPTATNIAAASAAMDKIGPSAQQFVLELHKLEPELVRLQQAAGAGLFPGLTEGIKEAQDALPAVERIFQRVGTEIGDLAAQAGRSLGSEEWAPFLKFIGDEAPRALAQMGHALGSVTHGLAELWMATEPLNSGGLDWIEHAADGFDRWATGLDNTQGFQDFMTYIQQHGPEVEQLLSDTASLFVDIVQAAAPLGGPTLHALDLIVKALDLIANSPLATPLLALLQLNSVLKLTSSGLGAVGINADLNLRKKIVGGAKAATDSLLTVTSAQDRARLSTAQLAAVEEERAKANRAALIKGAAALTGVALASSGAADAMGLQNTTMLATAGLVTGGPWAAAVGGGVGLALDWKAAIDADKASVDALQQSVSRFASTNDISGLGKMAASARGAIGPVSQIGAGIGGQLASQLSIPVTAFDTLSASISRFNTGLTGNDNPITKLSDLQDVATRMAPAMQRLGITFDDMLNMDPTELAATVDHLTRMTLSSEKAVGSAKSVGAAFAAMGNEALTTDQRVQGVTDALDALLDPKIDVSAASDAVVSGLHKLGSELDKNSHTLKGNSDAALTNRAVIRQRVDEIKAAIEAEARAGAAPDKLTESLKRQNDALIAAGVAAGVSRKDMQDYLKTLGLTPKALRTIISLNGLDAAERNLQHLIRDRVIHITARVDHLGVEDTTATGGHVLTGHADGGTVGGAPRRPYGDKVLIRAAPGEEIITNRNGEADQFRADRASGRIPAYANGGTVASQTFTRSSQRAPEIDYDRLTRALLAARPMYGPVSVNGDPTSFKNQMQQDARAAALGAVRP